MECTTGTGCHFQPSLAGWPRRRRPGRRGPHSPMTMPLDAQALGGFVVGALHPGADFGVAGEHGHVGVVPSRAWPAWSRTRRRRGRWPRPGRSELGAELGFRGDDRVHEVHALDISGMRRPGNSSRASSFLPLQGIRPLVVLHPHLVHGGGVAVGSVLDVLGRDPELVATAGAPRS